MEAFDDIKNELESIAPMLNKLPRTTRFTVDEGYFDELPTQVMDRIHATKTRRMFDLSWALQPRWAVSLAACFMGIVFASFFLLNRHPQAQQLSKAQIQQLLNEPVTTESILDNIDAEDLADAMPEPAAVAPDTQKQNLKKHADKKALEEYILDNDDDAAIIDVL